VSDRRPRSGRACVVSRPAPGRIKTTRARLAATRRRHKSTPLDPASVTAAQQQAAAPTPACCCPGLPPRPERTPAFGDRCQIIGLPPRGGFRSAGHYRQHPPGNRRE